MVGKPTMELDVGRVRVQTIKVFYKCLERLTHLVFGGP
jgi:hypothetical protein